MAANFSTTLSEDPRVNEILNLLVQYATGDYTQRATISGKGDDLDAIMIGLNTVAEEAHCARKITQNYLTRVERVMEVLLKYTMLDFSDSLEISDEKDEIDAIAIGLNTLAEELQTARAVEAEQMQVIRESREQIEVIINNAPNAVVVINEENNIVRWNDKAHDIFGWTQEEVLQKPMHEFIMPKRYESQHQEGLKHFLKTGEGPILNKLIEIFAVRKNGEEFPIELGISSVKSKGKFMFIAFIKDISERKRAERELINANLNLETSNKELEAFTYSVSHDLRAPLRAIGGYSQLLLEKTPKEFDAQTLGFLTSIAANTKRMGSLIDDLLSLSRFSRADLNKVTVDMNEIVTTVIDQLGKSDDLSKVKIKIGKLPSAKADHNLMVQVYTNLLSNAIKYSSLKENPEIEIGAMKEDSKVVYFVSDNGSGFDMEFYNKLFGVFQRLHDDTEFQGTGVGLAIVKRIIVKHEGEVWAKSEVDKGSTFYFTLKN